MLVRRGGTVYRTTDYSGQGLRFSSKHKLVKLAPDYAKHQPDPEPCGLRPIVVRRQGVVIRRLF